VTIKQLGGVFGRNPTFNDVTIEGQLTFDGDIDINSDLKVDGNLEVTGTSTLNGNLEIAKDNPKITLNDTDGGTQTDFSISANANVFSIYNETAAVNTLRIFGNTQDVRVETGNLVIATSGKGIDFSATAGAGSTSELLDDYEEGLHTATVVCGTSGTVTVNAGNNSLAYTKIGRQVSVTGFLYIDSVSSPVGYFDISLPITSANLAGGAGNSAASLIVRNVNTANVSSFVGYIPEASSVIRVYLGDSTNWVADSAQELKAVSQIYINATYMAA